MKRALWSVLLLSCLVCLRGSIYLPPGGQIRLAPGGIISMSPIPPVVALQDGDVTATMTADNAPSPNVVTSSAGAFSATYAVWKAWDGTSANYISAVTEPPDWLKFDFGAGNAHPIKKVRWKFSGLIASDTVPRNMTLAGSNDDSGWSEILTVEASKTWEWQEAQGANTTPYRYIRLYITDMWNNNRVYMEEIELWEKL